MNLEASDDLVPSKMGRKMLWEVNNERNETSPAEVAFRRRLDCAIRASLILYQYTYIGYRESMTVRRRTG